MSKTTSSERSPFTARYLRIRVVFQKGYYRIENKPQQYPFWILTEGTLYKQWMLKSIHAKNVEVTITKYLLSKNICISVVLVL